ncbi:MAG: YaeQ family protein [Bdellovibrionota bacterium]|jgi:uncharacterized protein YaeQ
MAFIDGLYTFAINLTDTDRNQYLQLRIKAAKHPNETIEYMLSRVLAFIHSYTDGIEFTQGLFDPKQPAIWSKDFLGDPTLWIEVGNPEKKRLYHASCDPQCLCRVYFFQNDQVNLFCHECMRGAATNWVEKIEFYQIDNNFMQDLSETLEVRSNWEVTIIDGAVYLLIDGKEFHSAITTLNIWSHYQLSIGNC